MAKAKPRDTWISEPGYRHYYTDADGVYHDILNLVECKKMLKHSRCPECDSLEETYRPGDCAWCDKREALAKPQ